jgi:dipeptidyl aminopeptidase/acylaminoacyl peptidase
MEVLFWVLVVAAAAILLYALWLALGRYFFRSYARPARMPLANTPADFGCDYRNLEIKTADGLTLKAWLIFPPSQAASGRLPVVITTHGYGTNRSDIIERSIAVARAGFLVLTFDWRCCGESEGNICTGGLREKEDLRAALDALPKLPEADPERVAVYGFSMGAVLAILIAAEDSRIKAVVADSPYSSMREQARHIIRSLFLPPALFLKSAEKAFKRKFGGEMAEIDALVAAPRIAPRPLLILGGERDRVVPPSHPLAIYEAADEPKKVITNPNGGHFDNATPETLNGTIIPFLKSALAVPAAGNRTGGKATEE